MQKSDIETLLADTDCEFHLQSPSGDYIVKYKAQCNQGRSEKWRTYELEDTVRGGTAGDPWGAYDYDKQLVLVTNLFSFSNYKLTKKIVGWTFVCDKCGHSETLKYHDNKPKKCSACKEKGTISAVLGK